MKGGFRKNETARRALARESHPVAVLVEPCPKCGVEGGAYCRSVKTYMNKHLTAAEPHVERIAVAELGRK